MTRFWRATTHPQERLQRLADEELIQRVAAGEADAFEVVLERHADAVFSLAYRICGRRPMAEDVTQQALLAIWRGGQRYDRSRGSVRNWVLGIAHHRAIDALRALGIRERRHDSDDGLEERLLAPERTDVEAMRNVAAQEVRSALSKLPSEQRQVIELAYFGGFAHTEIASMLDTPLGTVKGRMRLGLHRLRNHLGHSGTVLG